MELAFSKKALQRISDKLRHNQSLTAEEEKCFASYREAHNDILNAYQSIIRQRLTNPKYKNVIFGQRLKRRPTIVNKLSQRFSTMDLVRMHDIAGGRIIFPNLKLLYEFRSEFLRGQRRTKKYHQVRKEKYNYIDNPNSHTGYRGIHDIFEETTVAPIKARIEIQYRTQVQHAWATTCEIWDANFGDTIKFGCSDDTIQLFFKLISEFFARMLENLSFISDKDIFLYGRICLIEQKYHILSRLRGLNVVRKLSHSIPTNQKLTKDLLLLTRKIKETTVDFIIYDHIYDAMSAYSNKELTDPTEDNVLVKVSNKRDLKKAYNNYFNDMSAFFAYWKKARKEFHRRHKIIAPIIEKVFPIYRELTPQETKIFKESKLKDEKK